MTDNDVRELVQTIRSGEYEARIVGLFKLSNSGTALKDDVAEVVIEAFAQIKS